MKLWMRYLKEQKISILLCLIIVGLLVGVGSLYQIENVGKLLYAAFLALVVWGAAGIFRGMKYVSESKKLEEIYRHFEQSGELLTGIGDMRNGEHIKEAGTFSEAQWLLALRICEEMEKNRHKMEEKSAEYKDYYLMWTHQIKTPISALRLLLEGSEIPGRAGFLMREELFKIEQYVDMVLTFQRLESMSSDMVLQEYDLSSLIKQAVKKYSVLFINKGLRLELGEMDIQILTDQKWFIFCLEQILSNSIKYTPNGGITISAKENMLSIQDTGIGIRPEDLPRIFDKGFTGYNGRMEKKSTGIGLYLCRRICGQLGIQLMVESREGEGTRVILDWNKGDRIHGESI